MLPKSENACREDSETSIDFVVLSKPCWETTVTSDSTKVWFLNILHLELADLG